MNKRSFIDFEILYTLCNEDRVSYDLHLSQGVTNG
jgi:hypothetical protein